MKHKIKVFFRRFIWLDWLLFVLFCAGLSYLLTIGFFKLIEEKKQVEYFTVAEANGQVVPPPIYVDVSGAVNKPGVYKLEGDVRLKDALVAAGGLTERADRGFVSEFMNLAQKIKDGEKVYIPVTGKVEGARSSRININRVSVQELDILEGIGPARAEAIIKSRPYASVDELVSRKVLTETALNKIREKIAVY